jgi:hypothetical protein
MDEVRVEWEIPKEEPVNGGTTYEYRYTNVRRVPRIGDRVEDSWGNEFGVACVTWEEDMTRARVTLR